MNTVSARLRLLDVEIVDSDGLPIGRVADVELTVGDRGGAQVVALACGQGALGRRLGGTLGRFLQASAARLDSHGPGQPDRVARINAELVQEVSSVVSLSCPLRELSGVAGLERWLAVQLIGRLPGSGYPASRW